MLTQPDRLSFKGVDRVAQIAFYGQTQPFYISSESTLSFLNRITSPSIIQCSQPQGYMCLALSGLQPQTRLQHSDSRKEPFWPHKLVSEHGRHIFCWHYFVPQTRDLTSPHTCSTNTYTDLWTPGKSAHGYTVIEVPESFLYTILSSYEMGAKLDPNMLIPLINFSLDMSRNWSWTLLD